MNEENTIRLTLDPDNLPPLTTEQIKMIERLKAMPDEEIDLSDMPECEFKLPGPKTMATLRLDSDVLEWLAECRHGSDWKANFTLRHEMLRERGWAAIRRREAAEAESTGHRRVAEPAQA